MGWHSVNHEGRVMWEDSDGTRVSSTEQVEAIEWQRSCACGTTRRDVEGVTGCTLVVAFLIGMLIGAFVGTAIERYGKDGGSQKVKMCQLRQEAGGTVRR